MKKSIASVLIRLVVGLAIGLAVVGMDSHYSLAHEVYVNPNSSVQAAIDQSNQGDVIILLQGIYKEHINFKGKAITLKSINPNDPDVVAATIIDGNQTDRVVTFANNEGKDSILSGLTIRNGKAKIGGGIWCDSNSSPQIINCTISDNSAERGGGIECWGDTSISHCTISDNSAERGGGIYCWGDTSITNCTISDNSANDGGGIYCGGDSHTTISNCTISGNSANDGGGIKCWGDSHTTISNCTISGNSAQDDGGGIECWGDTSITNCTISGNSANDGGGIYCGGDTSITNCTISGNSANDGGGIECWGDTSISNSILWANLPNQIDKDSDSYLSITYSDIQGGWSGEGNIDADPLFVNPSAGDFHLQAGSPCIDAGHPRMHDVDDSRADMGAYGGEGENYPLRNITVAGDGSGDFITIQEAVNHAISGDTITVKAGTYEENIFILGKSISLMAQDGPEQTIIDGGQKDSVIVIDHTGKGETKIEGFTIRNGKAYNGGGIYCRGDSHTTITNCTISGNSANDGGGIYCRGDTSISHCTISGNSAYNGGGIYCWGDTSISNCTISGNSAKYGGGILCGGDTTISNCTISGNSAQDDGGGIYCWGDTTISNCTISGNSAERGGGIYCDWYSSPSISHCTISGNSANYGGGIYEDFSSPQITNCILWADSPHEIDWANSFFPTITYSDIQGGWSGQGNIDADPLFVDPNSGDYQLKAGSPCIDAANPNAPGLPATDIIGNPRVINGLPDMGAYEFTGIINQPPVLDLIGNKTVKENELLSFTIHGQDPDPNDVLIYSVSDLPKGASFDSEAGLFTWQPDYNSCGLYYLTFTVTDNGRPSRKDSETITIKVIDADGPKVILHSPAGNIRPPVDYLEIHFNKSIEPTSFTAEDVVMIGPGGEIRPLVISQVDPNSFQVSFPEQRLAGEYRLEIGPGILDLAENPMDQDGDHINGEEGEDVYKVTFFITPGLWIISHMPSGDQSQPVSRLTFTFSQEIKSASFTKDDIQMIDPDGKLIALTRGPVRVEEKSYQIEFAEQKMVGSYHVYVGPQIESLDGSLMDQDNDCLAGEPVEDRYDAWFRIIDLAGPQVVSHSPSGKIRPPIRLIEVRFSEAINPASFTVEDVSIIGPFARRISPQSISQLDSNSFRVSFPEQSSEGTYSLVIGPQVLDLAGNPLDQDQDGVNGEGYDDRYSASFIIDASGPRVIAASISGTQNVPVEMIDLTFSEPIISSTFTKEAVSVSGPAGKVTVFEIKSTGATTNVVQLVLSPSEIDGHYQLSLVPVVRDEVGNYLDQDQDGRQGEEGDDTYNFSFIQQLPDLVVTTISHPLEARASGRIEVAWTVTNQGLGRAIGQWIDTLYLSKDSAFGPEDVWLGEVQYNQPVDSGSSYSRTIPIILPDGIIGQQWIIVRTNSQGIQGKPQGRGIAEQGAGSNNTKVATPPLWITNRPYPDLQVSSVVTADKLYAGGKAIFSWKVENRGSGGTSAPFWYDKIYLSLDTTLEEKKDIELASIRNPEALATGESYTQTNETIIPKSVPAGFYYVLVKADADDKIEEFDLEENNVGQAAQRVETEAMQKPYLRVDYFHAPAKVKQGEAFTVEWKMTNIGEEATSGITGHDITISRDPVYDWSGDTPLMRTRVSYPSIPPGSSQTDSSSVTIPSGYVGKNYLFFVPDTRGGGSNVAGKDYGLVEIEVIVPVPDLRPTSISAPEAGSSGQNIALSWTVENVGNGRTLVSSWYDAIFLSEDQKLDEKDQQIAIIPHQGTVAEKKNYQAPATSVRLPSGVEGNFYIIIKTDSSNGVSESNEDNNLVVSDSPISVFLVKSDLQIQSATAPAVAMAGQPIIVQWTVINAGAEATAIGRWVDKIYLSNDDLLDPQKDTLLGSVWISSSPVLEPGQTYSQGLEAILPPKTEGSWHLFVFADANNDLYEHRAEENNVLHILPVLEISLAPDLVINSFTAPTDGIAGQSIEVSWTITNAGTAPTFGRWRDGVYLSAKSSFDSSAKLLEERFDCLESLAPGVSYGSNILRKVKLPPNTEGNYYLFLITDLENNIFEKVSGEQNNISQPQVIRIADLAADLTVESFSVPAQGIAGQSIQVDWRISNQGAVAAQAPWKDKIYLSKDAIFSPDDLVVASFDHTESLASGASYPPAGIPWEVKLPGQIEGTYYLFLVIDQENKVYEKESKGNNTSPAQIITIEDRAADLVLERFSAPATGVVNQAIQVDWRISNQGAVAAQAPWKDKIYLSEDAIFSPDDLVVASFDHTESLARGAGYGPLTALGKILISNLPNHREGQYYLFFLADANRSVYEKGIEANNLSQPQVVRLTELAPDLQIETASAPAKAVANGVVAVRWTVVNRGDDVVRGGWKDAIYFSEDTTFDPQKDRLCGRFEQTAVLEPGKSTDSATQPTFIRIPDRVSGTYYLLLVTDVDNSVYEKGSGEENNVFLISQPLEVIIQPADLQVTVVNAPLTSKAGSTISVSWTVTNRGKSDTVESFWKDAVYLSPDVEFEPRSDIALGQINHSGALAAGASYSASGYFTLRQDLAGPYYLYVVTDAFHQVFEFDQENNNTASSPGNIQINGVRVDLVVSELVVPTQAYQGGSVDISFKVTNVGSEATLGSSWEDVIYLSSSGELDAQVKPLATFKHQGALTSAESYTVTKKIYLANNKELKDLVGDFFIIVKTDASRSNDIYESEGEENNTACACLSIEPTPTPDLAVIEIRVPDSAWSGQNIKVEWTVSNIDSLASTSASNGFWDDTVYLSRDQYLDPGSDYALGSVRYQGTLAPGGSYRQSLEPKLPGWISGPYFIIVTADSSRPEHVFEQGKESNNTAVSIRPVEVNFTPPADLVVAAINPPAEGIYGEPTTWSFEVKNSGDLEAEGSWYDTLYLSIDQEWNLGDQRIGRLRHEGGLAAGQSYSATFTANTPAVVPGNYWLIATTDVFDDLRETDEENNTSVSVGQITVRGRELVPGGVERGALAKDQSVYYQISLEPGKDLVITVSGAAKDTAELYVAWNRIPTRAEFEVRGGKDAMGNLAARILGTKPGTYYILVYGYNCPNPGGSSFELTATLPGQAISSLSVDEAGNGGPATVEISGYNFSPKTKVWLKDTAGNIIAQGVVSFKDSGTLMVTFDLSGKPIGMYQIEVENPDGSVASKEFEVVQGRGGELYTRLLVPTMVRPGRSYTFSLEYGNKGDADIPAPLVAISAGGGAEVRLFPTEDWHKNPIQVLAIGTENPVDVLPPGYTGKIDMEVKAPSNIGENIPFYLKVMDQENEPIDWPSTESALRPQGVGDEVWTRVWQNLRQQLGETWGSYAQALREDARRLALRGERIYDVRQLFLLEMNVASGGYKGAIAGWVVDSETGKPVSGASISAYQLDGAGYGQAVSGEDGYYLLAGLPAGQYRLDIEAYVIEKGMKTEVYTDKDCVNHLIYVTRGGKISGYVRSSEMPLKGVIISVKGENTSWRAIVQTDEEGYYQLNGLPEDTYIVEAKADRYAKRKISNIFLAKGEIRDDLNFDLVKESKISGRVTDTSGHAVEGAYILATNTEGDRLAAITDKDGIYSITGIGSDNWKLSIINANGFLSSEGFVSLGTADSVSYNFTLPQSACILGTVSDISSGKPLASLPIFVLSPDGSIASFGQVKDTGSYKICGLPPGQYTITIGPPPGIARHKVVIRDGDLEQRVDFNLNIVSSISGKVLDVDGITPLSNVTVALTKNGQPITTTLTTNSGEYSFMLLASGRYDIEAISDSWVFNPYRNLQVNVGEQLTNINFIAGHLALTGRVVSLSKGEPLSNVLISIIKPENTLNKVANTVTDANGYFEIRHLQPGSYIIIATLEGYGRWRKEVNLSELSPLSLDIRLGPPARISGTVLNNNGKIINPTVLYAYDSKDKSIVAMTFIDKTGHYEISNLSAGTYNLYVISPESRCTAEVVINDGEHINNNFILTPSNISLSGMILDRQGLSLGNVFIQVLDSNENIVDQTVTDYEGRYLFTTLPSGTFSIRAFCPGGSLSRLEEITLSKGEIYEDVNLVIDMVAIGPLIIGPEKRLKTIFRAKNEDLDSHSSVFDFLFDPNFLFNFFLECLLPRSIYKLPWNDFLIWGENDPGIKYKHGEVIQNCDNCYYYYEEAEKTFDRINIIYDEWKIRDTFVTESIRMIINVMVTDLLIGAKDVCLIYLEWSAAPAQFEGLLSAWGLTTSEINILINYFSFIANFVDIALKGKLEASNVVEFINGFYSFFDTVASQMDGIIKKLNNLPWWSKLGLRLTIIGAILDAYEIYKTTSNTWGLFSYDRDKWKFCENIYNYSVNRLNQIYEYLDSCVTAKKVGECDKLVPPSIPPLSPLDTPTTHSTVAGSHDPNDKLTSLGVGSLLHISPDSAITYTIRFENDRKATAAAQLVTITDPLSPLLDWSTFTLGDMEFGSHHISLPPGLTYYSTEVDLRPEGNNLLVKIEASFNPIIGIVTWSFTSIDPATGELTEDPLAGFLPPNGENHEGEGYVKFSIKPRLGLPTGTTISNMASITFDWNPSMDTPLVFNTIDAGSPVSQVTALPVRSPNQFTVTWSGQDDADGSGIASYDIYVSENGGPYTIWLKNTTATSGQFSGTGGRSYAFYSVATDNVGHREQHPTAPDAITTTSINHAPSTPLIYSPAHQSTLTTTSPPTLIIRSSFDQDHDPLSYEFELYPNPDLTPPTLLSANAISAPEGLATISWDCPIPLQGNRWYSWRARAFDGLAYSDWTEGATFLVKGNTFRIPLGAGWNLISFPISTCWYDTEFAPFIPLPAGTGLTRVASLKEVLRSIDGQYTVILSFDQDGAHTFDPALDGQGFNDLHYLAPGYGYWIKMSQPATLELEADQLLDPSASLSLGAGWNLTGYWGREARYDLAIAPKISLPEGVQWLATPSLTKVLSSIEGAYSMISSFDQYGGHTFDPLLDGWGFNDLHYLSPGYGFWIKMTRPATLHY